MGPVLGSMRMLKGRGCQQLLTESSPGTEDSPKCEEQTPDGTSSSGVDDSFLEVLEPYLGPAAVTSRTPVWSVSENWRFEPAYRRLLRLLQESGRGSEILQSLDHMEIRTMAYVPDD